MATETIRVVVREVRKRRTMDPTEAFLAGALLAALLLGGAHYLAPSVTCQPAPGDIPTPLASTHGPASLSL